MIGLLLALIVAAIAVALLGGWIFGIVIGVAAIVLFVERCDELVALDDRLQELGTLLAAAVSARRAAPAARCECGAPIVGGSHFCANCGRPVAATPPVVACAKCGTALAADAKFCAVCGHAVEDAQASDLLEALPAPAQDPWES